LEPDGTVVLVVESTHRLPGSEQLVSRMGFVAKADGAVRQAFWQERIPGQAMITFGTTSIAPGKSGWRLIDMMDFQNQIEVPFAGDDTLLRPPVFPLARDSDLDIGTIWAGSDFYMERTRNQRLIRKWDGTDMGVAVLDTGEYSKPVWVGPTLLFALSDNPYYHLVRWTEHDGTRVLVGTVGDRTKGAGNPGSDGKDLVWLQGEGRPPGAQYFTDNWVMTSKYTTDPAQIQPRRLVRWPGLGIGTYYSPPPVGCGYAVYKYGTDEPVRELGLLVVRLSDGTSWRLIDRPDAPADGWFYPLAVTCDEFFAAAKDNRVMNIRRVRLDSLGPGTPPE